MTQEEYNLKYYEYFQELIIAMTDLNGLNMDELNKALTKICIFFRISKGVARFYDSLKHEEQGRCEEFVCYDSGEECREVEKIRVVTPAMTVATCSIYMTDDVKPLNEDEQFKVDLVMKTILSFISRSRLAKIVENLTFYDDSGYKNTRYFIRAIENFCEQGKIFGYVVAQLNLKHFTTINQEVGRAAGDVAMRNYITELEKACGEEGFVCRMGGDNFLAIFKQDRLSAVMKVLEGCKVVYNTNSGETTRVTANAGIYIVPEDYDEKAAGIMGRTVTALGIAKNDGQSDVVLYNEKMAANKEKLARIQQLLPDAMKNEEFKVYYQPKIDIKNGNLIGAEALCRWYHAGKIIQPNDFIPLMEMTTDICKLDFYMLEHVCRDIRRWLDEGKNVVRVSVNLSRKHMIDDELLDHIISIVDRNNVPHQYIEIELTETTTDVEFRDLKRVVGGLQMAGIYTSVDDFGMGYSSLNLIKEIPWNVMKVDRSFLPVEEDDEKSTRSIMFKYVVAMARELGLECIAEGVETGSQVHVLQENNCDLAQGFYFDKPLPVDDFEDRLKKHHYEVNV